MADTEISLRDQIAQAVAEQEKDTTTQAAPQPQQEAKETPKPEAQQTETRDDKGRFTKPETGEKPETDPEKPEGEKPADSEKPEADAKPESADEVKVPEHWSQADKERFNGLPKESKEFVMDRYKAMEGDYTRRVQRLEGFRKEYEPVEQLLGPHRQTMMQRGWTVPKLISAWASVEQGLNTNAPQQLIAIARAYNVTPQQLISLIGGGQQAQDASAQIAQDALTRNGQAAQGQNGQSQFPPGFDPNALLKPVMDQLAQLSERVNGRDQQEQQREYNGILSDIDEFAAEKSANGQLAHPYFDDVVEHMALMAQAERAAGRVPDLQSLYDQAVWARPETRDRLLASQRQAEQSKAQAEARAKAAQAQRAGSSVAGAPSPGQTALPTPKTLRETIEMAADGRLSA